MLRMVPLPVPGRIGNGRSPPQSRRSNYLAYHILRTAQPDAFARFDDRALDIGGIGGHRGDDIVLARSEEHTSELQSLMRISYAVFCLKKKKKQTPITLHTSKDIASYS